MTRIGSRPWLSTVVAVGTLGLASLFLVSGMAATKAVVPGKNNTSKAEGPAWNSLSASQQQALKPLEASWPGIGPAQKRKWIAISKNFPKLPAIEQTVLHSRMADWAAMSPQQRAQARLNFGRAKQITHDEKKAKWDAYQALSPEEKKRLQATAAPKPGIAAAIKPVPKSKLASVPHQRPAAPGSPKAGEHESASPKIVVNPRQIQRNTLLPQPVLLTTPEPAR